MARRNKIAAYSLAAPLALPFGAFAAMKHYDNRYEGTSDELHGNPDYELLGFFAVRQDYPLRDDVTLRIRFYLPGNDQFVVKAREIKVDKQYLMRPIPDKVRKDNDGWREFDGCRYPQQLRGSVRGELP